MLHVWFFSQDDQDVSGKFIQVQYQFMIYFYVSIGVRKWYLTLLWNGSISCFKSVMVSLVNKAKHAGPREYRVIGEAPSYTWIFREISQPAIGYWGFLIYGNPT